MSTDEDEFEDLAHAIVRQNVERAKRLIKEGADIQSKSWDGKTPLYIAIENRVYEISTLLVQSGADLNAKSINRTAFEELADNIRWMDDEDDLVNILETVKSMIERGLPKEELNKALFFAKGDLFKLLVEGGADLNTRRYKDGQSVLMHAARKGWVDKVDNILQYRDVVDLNMKNENGKTALHLVLNTYKYPDWLTYRYHSKDQRIKEDEGRKLM